MIDISPNMILVVNEHDDITLINKVTKTYFDLPEGNDQLSINSVKAKNAAFNQLFPATTACIEK